MRLGYLRVSTHEQTPARQLDSLHHRCDRLHVETVSANQRKRPVFTAVLRQLHKGDTLVIHDIDRGFRSALEAFQVMHRLHARGVAIEVLSLNISTTTPEGELMYTITSAYARYEWRCLSRRTKEGMRAARERGAKIGRPRVISDERIASARRRIDAGQSVRAVAADLNIGASTLYRRLDAISSH